MRARLAGALRRAQDPPAHRGDGSGRYPRGAVSLVEANRALGLRAVATAQRLSDDTLRAVLNLTDPWRNRATVYREIPDLIDDPERALALVDRLCRRMRDGNDLYFLAETAAAITERWPEAQPLAEQLRKRFFDHIPEPAGDLFRRGFPISVQGFRVVLPRP